VLGTEGYNPSGVQYDGSGPLPTAPTGAAPGSAAAPRPASATPPVAKGASPAPDAPKSLPKPVSAAAAQQQQAFDALPAEEKINNAIQTISKYRTAGAGGEAFKLLRTFVKNIAENPSEPKYAAVELAC
jgi:hypothetical protein